VKLEVEVEEVRRVCERHVDTPVTGEIRTSVWMNCQWPFSIQNDETEGFLHVGNALLESRC
jgi:hypothetical protein